MKKTLLLIGLIGFFQNAYSFSFGSSSFLKTRAIAITTACASLKTSGISLFKAAKTIAFEYPKITALCLAAVATGYAVYKYFKPKSTTQPATTQPATTKPATTKPQRLFVLKCSPEGLSDFEKKLKKISKVTHTSETRTQQRASEGATGETERPSASASQASEGASSGAGAAEIKKPILQIPHYSLIEYNFADDAMWYDDKGENTIFEEAIITVFNKKTNKKEFYLFSGTEQTKYFSNSDETPQSNCERASTIRSFFLSINKQDAVELLYVSQHLKCAKLITEAEAVEKKAIFTQKMSKKQRLLAELDAFHPTQRKPSASASQASEGASSGAGAASVKPKLSAEEAEKLAMALSLAKVLSTDPTAQAAFAAYTASASQPDKAGAARAATA